MASDDIIIIISVTCAVVGLLMIGLAILGYIYIWKQKRKLQTVGFNSDEVIRIDSTNEKSASDKIPITNMEDKTISTVNPKTDHVKTPDKVQTDEPKEKISDQVIIERESYPKFVSFITVGNEKVSKSKPPVSTKTSMSGKKTPTNNFANEDGDQDTAMQETNQRIVRLFTAGTENIPESTKTDEQHKTKKIKKSRSKSMKSISSLEKETSTNITALTRNETFSIPVKHAESEHLKDRSDSLVNTFIIGPNIAASRCWEDLSMELACIKDSGYAGDIFAEKDVKHFQLKEKTNDVLSDTSTSTSVIISPVLAEADEKLSLVEVQKKGNTQAVLDPDNQEPRTDEISVIAILPFDYNTYDISSQTLIHKEANDDIWRPQTPQPLKTSTLEKPTRLIRCKSVPSNLGWSSALRYNPRYQVSDDRASNDAEINGIMTNPNSATRPSQCVQNDTYPVSSPNTVQITDTDITIDSGTLNVDKENKGGSGEHVQHGTIQEKVNQSPMFEPKANDEQEEIKTSSDVPSHDLVTHVSIVPETLTNKSNNQSMTSDNAGLKNETKDTFSATTCQTAGCDASIGQSNGGYSSKHESKGIACDYHGKTLFKESNLEHETNTLTKNEVAFEGGLVPTCERSILINRSHAQNHCVSGSKSQHRKRKYSLLRSATPIPTTEAKPKRGILKRSTVLKQLPCVMMPEENEEERQQEESVSEPSCNGLQSSTKTSQSALETLHDEKSENTQQTGAPLIKSCCFTEHNDKELKDIHEIPDDPISYDFEGNPSMDECKTSPSENEDTNTDATSIQHGLETSLVVPNESTIFATETTMIVPSVATERNESLLAFDNLESSESEQNVRSELYLDRLKPTDTAKCHQTTDSYDFIKSVEIVDVEENQDGNLSTDSGLVLYTEVSDSDFLVDNQAYRGDENQDANKDNHKLYQNATNEHKERILEDDSSSRSQVAHPSVEYINHHNSGLESSELKSALHLDGNGRTDGKDVTVVTSHLSAELQSEPIDSESPAYHKDAHQYGLEGNKDELSQTFKSNTSLCQTDTEAQYFDGNPICSDPNGFEGNTNERHLEGWSWNDSTKTEKSKGSHSKPTKSLSEKNQDMVFKGMNALNNRELLDSQHLEIRSLTNTILSSEKTPEQKIDSAQQTAYSRTKKKKNRSKSLVAHSNVRTECKFQQQKRRVSLREPTSDQKAHDASHVKPLLLNDYSAESRSLSRQTGDNEASRLLQSLPKTSSSVFEANSHLGPDEEITLLTVNQLQTNAVTIASRNLDTIAIETVSKANTTVRPQSSKGRSRSVNAEYYKDYERTIVAQPTNVHETQEFEKSTNDLKTSENYQRPTPAKYLKKEWKQSESEIGFVAQTNIPIETIHMDRNTHTSNDTIDTKPRSRPKSANYRSREDGDDETLEKETALPPTDIQEELVKPYDKSSHSDSAGPRSRPKSAKHRSREGGGDERSEKETTIPSADIPGELVKPYDTSSHSDSAGPRSRPKSAKHRSREGGDDERSEKETTIPSADIPGELVKPYNTSSQADSAGPRSKPESAKARSRPKFVTIPEKGCGLGESCYDNDNRQSNSNAAYTNTGLKRNATFQNSRIENRGNKNHMMRSKSVNLHDDKLRAHLSSINLQSTQNRSPENSKYLSQKSDYSDEIVHSAMKSMGRRSDTGSGTYGLTIDVDLDKQVAARRSITTENGTRNERTERERPQSSYGRSRGRSFNEYKDKPSRFRPTSACELVTPRRITKIKRPKETTISLSHRNGDDTLSETGDSSDDIEVSTFLIPSGRSTKGEHINKTSTWSDRLHGQTIPSSRTGHLGLEDVSMASKHNTSVGEFQNGSHTNGRVTGIFSRHASQSAFPPEHDHKNPWKYRIFSNDKPSATSIKVSSTSDAEQMQIRRRIKDDLSLINQHTQFTNTHELKQQSPKSPILGFDGHQPYGSIHQAIQPRGIKPILSRSKTMGYADRYTVGIGNTPTTNVKTKHMLAKSQSFHNGKDKSPVTYRRVWHPSTDPVLQDMDSVTHVLSKESDMVKTAEKLRAHSRRSNQMRSKSFLF